MWSWGNCSHSLLTSAPVWQACKISVYIIAWQQCADISISHVTTWNNLVKNILQSILTTFCSVHLNKVMGVEKRTRLLWWNFNDVNNHWQGIVCRLLHAQGGIYEIEKIFFCVVVFFMLESEWTTYSERKEKRIALTASDSVSFQSACIRFITFLSLHLVDASRVWLHWYGRGGLSCDYDIFLGALSSHSISLG